MGLPEGWLVLDKPRHNRLALKALGNANPPVVIAAVGRAIMQVDETLKWQRCQASTMVNV